MAAVLAQSPLLGALYSAFNYFWKSSTSKHETTTVTVTEVPPSPTESTESLLDANAALAASLRGKVIKLTPRALSIFADEGWPINDVEPAKMNPFRKARYERVVADVDRLLHKCLHDNPKRLRGAQNSEFPLFAMVWLPDIESYEDFWATLVYAIWLFIWDDYTDTADETDLANDLDKADAWRNNTIAQVKHLLGLNGPGDKNPGPPKGPMLAFAEFAERARKKWTRAQKLRIYYETAVYITASGKEQEQRLNGEIPDRDEYLRGRFQTSAVMCTATDNEMLHHSEVPEWIFETPEMQALRDAGNYVVSIHNDIFSLRKELVNNCVINLVAVMYNDGVPWDEVMPRIQEEIEENVKIFDDNARALLEMTKEDPEAHAALKSWLLGFRLNTTGNLTYSIVSKRYKGGKVVTNEDGSMELYL